MIQISHLRKTFDNNIAIDDISTCIKDGEVFGLIGSNGSGKSTLLKIISAILRQDKGSITVDGESIFENIAKKQDIFYISDEQYFFPNINAVDLYKFYACVYPKFDKEKYMALMKLFNLELNKKINSYSKGQKKQLSVITALSANTKYILCDETFDGIDAVGRKSVKSLFANEMSTRGLTPVIATHNLNDLEDICDHVALMHLGNIIFDKDLDCMKAGIHKLNMAIDDETDIEPLKKLNIINKDKKGSLHTMTIKADIKEIEDILNEVQPKFFEILPLSLEEVFISETEVLGYDVKNIIL